VSITRYAAMVRRSRLLAIVVTASLVAGACGGSAATQAPAGVELVREAAVSATIGADGGELSAADPARGRSYRVSVPAGAFAEDTEVTVTPIASIDGFPLDGGFVAGVELEPSGTTFRGPVILEISLDTAQQTELRSAVDAGQAIVGFEYPDGGASAADSLEVTLADVAADLSTVTLHLAGFSGHGAGKASPGNLASRPCPSDPAKHARCEITKILNPKGGPADPADPAVRAQMAQVLRDWLDVLLVVIDASTSDPFLFTSAAIEGQEWWSFALLLGLLGPGAPLEAEEASLKAAVVAGWPKAFRAANEQCKRDQSLAGLAGVFGLQQDFERFDWAPALSTIVPAVLAPSTFCLRLELNAASGNLTELAEGASGGLEFFIHDAAGVLKTDAGLDILHAEVVARPADASILSASGGRLGVGAFVNVTAVRAIPGNTAEGAFDVELRLFGLPVAFASRSVALDITSTGPTPTAPPAPIVCSGSPAKVTTGADSAWVLIRFDPLVRACQLFPALTDDDDPNAILAVDLDPGDSGWDAHDGANWTREGTGTNNAAGTYHIRVRHDQSGRWYIVTLTVEIVTTSGGSGGTMTVRDVSIAETS